MCAFAKGEGGLGAGGGEEEIALSEGFFKILAEEGADFLGLAIVGVGIALAEDKGAEDDAAFDFCSKSFRAGAMIEVENIAGIGGASAVADSVEAGEIGGGLGSGEDVVDGDGSGSVGEGDVDESGAVFLEPIGGGADSGFGF